MSEQSLTILALWFETTGFLISSVLIITVKWEAARLFLINLRNKIIHNKQFSSIIWMTAHLIAYSPRIYPHKPKRTLMSLLVFILAPIINLIFFPLSIILSLPVLLLSFLSVFFFSKNRLTNTLLILGTCMVLTGIIIKLIISY